MHVDLILEVESVLILVSAECRAQKMCVEALLKSAIRHMQALSTESDTRQTGS